MRWSSEVRELEVLFPLLRTEFPAWCAAKWKGTRSYSRAWREMGTGSVGDPIELAIIDSWRKCYSWTSSARTRLCSSYWHRNRDRWVTEPPGRNLDSLMCSLFCHTSEEPSLYLVSSHLSPNSNEPERQKTDWDTISPISSNHFTPHFFSCFSFPYLLVLISHSLVSLPCKIATSFYRGLHLVVLYGTTSPSNLWSHCVFPFLTLCCFEGT